MSNWEVIDQVSLDGKTRYLFDQIELSHFYRLTLNAFAPEPFYIQGDFNKDVADHYDFAVMGGDALGNRVNYGTKQGAQNYMHCVGTPDDYFVRKEGHCFYELSFHTGADQAQSINWQSKASYQSEGKNKGNNSALITEQCGGVYMGTDTVTTMILRFRNPSDPKDQVQIRGSLILEKCYG